MAGPSHTYGVRIMNSWDKKLDNSAKQSLYRETFRRMGVDMEWLIMPSTRFQWGKTLFDYADMTLAPGDTVVFYELMDVAPTLREIAETVTRLKDMGAAVDILDFGRMDDTETGRALYAALQTLGRVADRLAHNAGVRRRQDAKDRAKAGGKRVDGRPAFGGDRRAEAVRRHREGESYAAIARALGMSKATVGRILKDARERGQLTRPTPEEATAAEQELRRKTARAYDLWKNGEVVTRMVSHGPVLREEPVRERRTQEQAARAAGIPLWRLKRYKKEIEGQD